MIQTNIQVNIEVIDDNGISSTVNPSRILNIQTSLQSPQVSGTFSSDKTVNEGGSNVISLLYAKTNKQQTTLNYINQWYIDYIIASLYIVNDLYFLSVLYLIYTRGCSRE